MVPSITEPPLFIYRKQRHSPLLKFQDAQDEIKKSQIHMLIENVSKGNVDFRVVIDLMAFDISTIKEHFFRHEKNKLNNNSGS